MDRLAHRTNQSIQPSNRYVLALHHYLYETLLPGARLHLNDSSGELKFEECDFVPLSAIQAYFSDREKLEEILRSLFGADQHWPYASTVLTRCIRLFCLLARIGGSQYIRHCVENGIWDSSLPSETFPRQLESIAQIDRNFKSKFMHHQWSFFPHEFRLNDIDLGLSNSLILPIKSREIIHSNDQRSITKIVLHAGYHDLRPICENLSGVTDAPRDVFVLKSVNASESRNRTCYNNEVKALSQLGCNGLGGSLISAPDDIVRTFGSFTQGGYLNIVLEYADRGTLEDYFSQVEPPQDKFQFTAFWKSMKSIPRGVSRIHKLAMNAKGVFQGRHQDIKPSNILVFSNGTSSPYDVKFKIADLGLCSLTHGEHYVNNVHGRGQPGTRTFGSPESYRARQFRTGDIDTDQASDVWSLTCIFSIAATWAIGGKDMLKEYTYSRQEARKELNKSSDCFHDDETVLKVVAEWHYLIQNDQRDYDFVTPNIWHKLLVNFFGSASDRRATAFQMALDDLLKPRPSTAGSSFHSISSDNIGELMAAGSGNSQLQHSTSPIRNRRERTIGLPPSSPPSTARRSVTDIPQTSRQIFHEPEELDRAASSQDTSYGSHSRSALGGSFRSSSLSQAPSYPSSTSQEQSWNKFSPQRARTSMNGNLQNEYRDHEVPLRLSGLRQAPTLSEVAEVEAVSAENTPTPNLPASPVLNQHMGLHHESCPMNPQTRGELDHMSRKQLARWKEAKDRGQDIEVPHSGLKEHLMDRDFVFLFETSTSMKTHWPDVVRLFSGLSKFIKECDKDGMGIYFTVGRRTENSARTRELVQIVADAGSKCDCSSEPTHALRRIWKDYKEKVGNGKKNWMHKSRKRAKLNVYVFTDGVWQQGAESSMRALLEEIVTFVKHNNCEEDQVGIQFIQFGDGQAETDMLDHLDRELGLALGRDIVDVEPAIGNVWKMLLGTVSKCFDDDFEPICTCSLVRP